MTRHSEHPEQVPVSGAKRQCVKRGKSHRKQAKEVQRAFLSRLQECISQHAPGWKGNVKTIYQKGESIIIRTHGLETSSVPTSNGVKTPVPHPWNVRWSASLADIKLTPDYSFLFPCLFCGN